MLSTATIEYTDNEQTDERREVAVGCCSRGQATCGDDRGSRHQAKTRTCSKTPPSPLVGSHIPHRSLGKRRTAYRTHRTPINMRVILPPKSSYFALPLQNNLLLHIRTAFYCFWHCLICKNPCHFRYCISSSTPLLALDSSLLLDLGRWVIFLSLHLVCCLLVAFTADMWMISRHLPLSSHGDGAA